MTDCFIAFLCGFGAGAIVGIMFFACIIAAKDADARRERMRGDENG